MMVLLEGADHHDVAHPRNHLRRILDRLAAPELRIAGIEVDAEPPSCMPASKDRRVRVLAFRRSSPAVRSGSGQYLPVGLELVLDPARTRRTGIEFVTAEILNCRNV